VACFSDNYNILAAESNPVRYVSSRSIAKLKLKEYFAPKKNTEYEVYRFRQAKQSPEETIDSFHTRLRQLALNCEFADTSKEVKAQIIQGTLSPPQFLQFVFFFGSN
jgi:hypothetical protein